MREYLKFYIDGQWVDPVETKTLDVDNPTPAPGETSVRAQAQARGAALVVRGEGLWLHRGAVYFSATTGGPVGPGLGVAQPVQLEARAGRRRRGGAVAEIGLRRVGRRGGRRRRDRFGPASRRQEGQRSDHERRADESSSGNPTTDVHRTSDCS